LKRVTVTFRLCASSFSDSVNLQLMMMLNDVWIVKAGFGMSQGTVPGVVTENNGNREKPRDIL